MTLVDNETGKNIINPYITIYGPNRMKWAALNTSTFGRVDGEIEMISIHDEERLHEEYKKGNNLYGIVATVAKTNAFIKSVRTSGADDAISLTPMGYVPADFVKKCLPHSWKYFEAR